jgi:uncharacterized membrane protein
LRETPGADYNVTVVHVVSLAAAVLCFLCFLSCDRNRHHQEVSLKGDGVTIPLDDSISGKPRFYSVSLDGTKVKFFLVRVNGEPQSYFDACLSCYQRKQGFREEEGYMICKSCSVKYPVEELRTGIGGCYAIRLPGSVHQGSYSITREALKAGAKYF